MSKVIHHDQMSSLSSANNQQLMKTNSKFQITEQNNISIETINDLFFVVTFGLVFSKDLLLMSFTITRSGNYLIWCLCLFVELRRKKKVTLQQISYSEETKNFHFQYISILVLISYILQNVTI